MKQEIIDFTVMLIPIVTSWIVTGFGYAYYMSIYPRRYSSLTPLIVSYIVVCAATNAVNMLAIPYLNITFMFVIWNVVAFTLFKVRLTHGFLYNQLFIVVMMLCETLAMSVVSLNTDIPLYTIINSEQEYALTCLLDVVMSFVGARILILVVSRRTQAKIRFSEIFILTLLIVFEIFVLNYMIFKSETMADVDRLVVTILGFFVLNAFMVVAVRHIAELYKVRYEAEMIKQQSTLQLAHYNEMIENYDRYRKVAHDIRKHLATLDGLPAAENEEYRNYSEAFLSRFELLFDEFECDNHILSIIMTQKLRLAKEHGIKNFTRIENVDIGFMEDIDITALFANLWDNAIEACTEIPLNRRFINMYLITKNDMILVQFENSCKGEIPEERGHYVSAKGGEHAGMGLQIIHDTAQKYGGHFITDMKNDIFTATVMLTGERQAL
jgi:hypothetical protein